MRSRFSLLHITVLFVAQVFASGLLVGAEPAAPAPAAFKAGDCWCAVGDSITHGGLYHAQVYLFHATRFPDRRIEIFNCGISGDSAGGAFKRLPNDILSHKPTVASIMLGMNDVNRGLYNKGAGGPQIEEQRKRAIEGWAANMRKLVEGLKAAGVRVIFITPSIFDQTAVFPGTNDPGLVGPNAVGGNSGLGEMAKRVHQMAREFDAHVVDFHGPMSKIISPIYMAIVTIAAIAVGSVSESSFLFPKVNDPVYTPIVIPNRAKNTAISTADNGETVISPVR